MITENQAKRLISMMNLASTKFDGIEGDVLDSFFDKILCHYCPLEQTCKYHAYMKDREDDYGYEGPDCYEHLYNYIFDES